MDVRKLAKALMILGILACLGGSLTFLSGQSSYAADAARYDKLVQDLAPNTNLNKAELLEVVGRPSGYAAALEKDRSSMEQGKMIALLGGVLLVAGGVFMFAAKKPEPQTV
jgi:hypothetical protein